MKTVSLGDRPLTKPDGYARSRSAGISSIPLFDKSVIDSRALSSSPRNPSCGRRGPGPSDSQISRSQISQATHSGLGILTSHKVFVFIVFSFRASVALLSLPNVICGRRLEEAGKSQPRGANESLNPSSPPGAVVGKLCLTLAYYETHLSPGHSWPQVGHTPRTQPHSLACHPSGLCAFFKEEQRQSGPLVFFAFGFLFSQLPGSIFWKRNVLQPRGSR